MDDFFLKFQGFHPSDFTRVYLNHKLGAIRDEAPYGANVQATFTKYDHAFKGMITICSSAGKFFAVASGDKLKDVTQKLIDQIRKQLNRWKSLRFTSERFHADSFLFHKSKRNKVVAHEERGMA